MKAFKDLIIRSEYTVLKDILTELPQKAPINWRYRRDLVDEYARNVSKSPDEVSCFESPATLNEPALVWMVIWNNELKVVNIVPISSHSLGFDKYNNILDHFFSDCVSDVIKDKDVIIEKTEGKFEIEEIAGNETFMRLDRWEQLCNRSTGNTHPSDFKRWADFVCIAFQKNSKLSPDLLERWLIEDRNWASDKVVEDIVSDYEYGISIIKHYAQYYQSNHH